MCPITILAVWVSWSFDQRGSSKDSVCRGWLFGCAKVYGIIAGFKRLGARLSFALCSFCFKLSVLITDFATIFIVVDYLINFSKLDVVGLLCLWSIQIFAWYTRLSHFWGCHGPVSHSGWTHNWRVSAGLVNHGVWRSFMLLDHLWGRLRLVQVHIFALMAASRLAFATLTGFFLLNISNIIIQVLVGKRHLSSQLSLLTANILSNPMLPLDARPSWNLSIFLYGAKNLLVPVLLPTRVVRPLFS